MKKYFFAFLTLLFPVLTFSQNTDTICFYRSSKLSFYLETYDGWTNSLINTKSIGENATIFPKVDDLTNNKPIIYVSTLELTGKNIKDEIRKDYRLARKENRKIQKHPLLIKNENYKTYSQLLFIRNELYREIIYLNPTVDDALWIRLELIIKHRQITRNEAQYFANTVASFRKILE